MLREHGRHERMHRTLKAEATRPAAGNLAAQQRKFNRFREEYNQERPHEALDQETPASQSTSRPRARCQASHRHWSIPAVLRCAMSVPMAAFAGTGTGSMSPSSPRLPRLFCYLSPRLLTLTRTLSERSQIVECRHQSRLMILLSYSRRYIFAAHCHKGSVR